MINCDLCLPHSLNDSNWVLNFLHPFWKETKPKKAKEAGTVTGAGTAAALKQSKLKKKNDKAK